MSNGRGNGQVQQQQGGAPAIFSTAKITLIDGTVFEHVRVQYTVAMLTPQFGNLFIKELDGDKAEHVYPLTQLKALTLVPSPLSGITLVSN